MATVMNWLKGPWSSGSLIVLVAAFVATFANTSFFTSAAQAYPPGDGYIHFLVSLYVFITSVFVLVLSVFSHGRATKPLLVVFLLLSSAIAYFADQYGTVFDRHMLENVFQTQSTEVRDLITWPLVMYVGILGVLPSVLVWKAPVTRGTWKQELLSRAKLVAGTLAMFAAIYFAFSAHYTSMFRMQREVVARINPTKMLFSAVKLARVSLESRSYPHMIVGADAKSPVQDKRRELVIMIVGETARADRFSLNGYERETNPLLKKEQLFNFPDFWSCGTSTAQSVPCMFSHFTRADFESRRAKSTDNALDVLKRVGVAVLWRDNNSSSKGVADRVTYEHYMEPDTNPVCDTECRDEGMLVGLQEYIDANAQGDIMIVLHAMGNHGPAYYKRYPAAFEKFKPVCKTNDLGSCTDEEISNAYDNAILYTDYFLAKAIALLKRNDEKFETAMFYVSDHGESLGENGHYLHGLPYFLAPDEQKRVPAIMWFGRNFDSHRLAQLEERRTEPFSHDNIFSTLLGFFEVRSDAYDPKLDILGPSRPEHW
jgi:lipid A ethanolaminephosphotransferase